MRYSTFRFHVLACIIGMIFPLSAGAQTATVPGLMLAVCPLSPDSDRRIPSTCTGLPPVAARVGVPDSFDFRPALAQQRMNPYLAIDNGGIVGVRWTGEMRIERFGDHTFQVEVSLADGGGERIELYCPVRLRISGEQIAAVGGDFETWRGNAVATEQGTALLEPGSYPFEVFVACHARIHFNTVVRNADMRISLERVRVRISFAEPGANVLSELPTDRLRVAQ